MFRVTTLSALHDGIPRLDAQERAHVIRSPNQATRDAEDDRPELSVELLNAITQPHAPLVGMDLETAFSTRCRAVWVRPEEVSRTG